MSAPNTLSERFPRDLLSATKHVRHQYFCNWMVEHPRLVEAKETLLSAIRYANGPAGQSLIQIVGCSGVGKTTLKHWVERLLKEAEATMQATQDIYRWLVLSHPCPIMAHSIGAICMSKPCWRWVNLWRSSLAKDAVRNWHSFPMPSCIRTAHWTC